MVIADLPKDSTPRLAECLMAKRETALMRERSLQETADQLTNARAKVVELEAAMYRIRAAADAAWSEVGSAIQTWTASAEGDRTAALRGRPPMPPLPPGAA